MRRQNRWSAVSLLAWLGFAVGLAGLSGIFDAPHPARQASSTPAPRAGSPTAVHRPVIEAALATPRPVIAMSAPLLPQVSAAPSGFSELRTRERAVSEPAGSLWLAAAWLYWRRRA